MTPPYRITPVVGTDCRLVEGAWDFAVERTDEIDRHWAKRLNATPELFNGEVLLLGNGEIVDSPRGAIFRGSFIETEFKAFLTWREFGVPPSSARNCFAMAAIETADGAFVLGEMAPHTAPAGQIYFPSGTPDRLDVFEGRVDLDGSARRELREETGLGPDEVAFDSGFVLVTSATRICCMKPVRSAEPAARLVEQIHRWLALDAKSELARMHIVRSPADIRPAMPDFVVAYLNHMFARR